MVVPAILPAAATAAASIADKVFGFSSSKSSAKKEYQRQKEFAQNQIQWRVKDAQAAGIHPLYALGAQGVSYAPQAATGLDLGFGEMSQDLSRAMQANMDRRERFELQQWERQRAAAADALAMEKHRAELALIGSETQLNYAQTKRTLQGDQLGPGVPYAGAAPGDVAPLPSQPIVGSVGNPGVQPGVITDLQYARGADGLLRPVQSQDYKQRAEDDIVAQAQWHLRNTILPGFDVYTPPNPSTVGYPPRQGYRWRWSWWAQAYEEVPIRR